MIRFMFCKDLVFLTPNTVCGQANSSKSQQMNAMWRMGLRGAIPEAAGPAGKLLQCPRWEMMLAVFRKGLAVERRAWVFCCICLQRLLSHSSPLWSWPCNLHPAGMLSALAEGQKTSSGFSMPPIPTCLSPHIWGNHRVKGVSWKEKKSIGRGGVGSGIQEVRRGRSLTRWCYWSRSSTLP